MVNKFKRILVVISLCIFIGSTAFAGSPQGAGETFLPAERVAIFAKKVEKFAAERGAQVFLLARLGIPKAALPEGIQFTHVGIAVYSKIKTGDGKEVPGYAVYNLYQRESDMGSSHLVQDFPFDFFSGARELKAGVILPVSKLQQKILESLELKRNEKLHNAEYSIISNPFSTKYQNCTEHILDILFASIYGTDSIEQIKANQRVYFQAHSMHLSPFKKLFAPMLSSSIRLSDHKQGVSLATFTTIANFLEQHGLASERSILIEDKAG